jgi:hypothetical protein
LIVAQMLGQAHRLRHGAAITSTGKRSESVSSLTTGCVHVYQRGAGVWSAMFNVYCCILCLMPFAFTAGTAHLDHGLQVADCVA